MESGALGALKAAFEEWRSNKRYLREAIPAALLERARQAARRHGPAAVARATKVELGRLKVGYRRPRRPVAHAPAFSRLEVTAPARTASVFAEVEMASGLKVRLFTQSAEALGLLSALLSVGGER